jgi:hypothetical protein
MYFGQAEQDKFALHVLKHKSNGYFLEIGSNHPIHTNNTYLMEKKYNWKGIMVEVSDLFMEMYAKHRPNSIHIIKDATQVHYRDLLDLSDSPTSIDYLQIDLEPADGSTLKTLQKLDAEVFDKYKFATITFEHDYYRTNAYNTRLASREILLKRGYVCVFEDIHNIDPNIVYEDWYVHPELVDMEYVNTLIKNNQNKYIQNHITGKSINWQHIVYH